MKTNQLISQFLKEEKDLTKRLKNLIIECIEKSFLGMKALQRDEKYHIWSIYPTCTLTFEGIDEVLKIEKEVHSYYFPNDCTEYNIYGTQGIIVHSGFTDLNLKAQLLKQFKKSGIKSVLVKEIIDYLYSGKIVSTYSHIGWEEAKKEQ